MRKQKTHRAVYIFFAATAVLSLFLTLVFINYNSHVNSEVRLKISEALRTNAAQQKKTVNELLDSQFESIETLATFLGTITDEENYQQHYFDLMHAACESDDYFAFTALDESGIGYRSDGKFSGLANRTFFRTALSGERAITDPFVGGADGKSIYITLAVPIPDPEGDIIGVLCGEYLVENIGRTLLQSSEFDIEYTVIIDQDGEIVVTNEVGILSFKGDNYLTTKRFPTFYDGKSYETMRVALLNEEIQTYLVSDGETDYYLTQTPVGYNGWSMITVSPAAALNSRYDFLRYASERLNFSLAGVAAVCLALLLVVFLSERRDLKDENKKLEAERLKVSLSEKRYRIITLNSGDVIFELNLTDQTVETNENFERFFSVRPTFSIFESGSFIHPEDTEAYLNALDEVCKNNDTRQLEVRMCRSEEKYFWADIVMSPLPDAEDNVTHIVGRITDIDAQKRAAATLSAKAQTDLMTGLLNKTATEDMIRRTLDENIGGPHGLMIIDLDDLKHINDKGGHPLGDKAIKAVATTLRGLFRSSDIVGRFGGDEYMVFLRGIRTREQLCISSASILREVAKIDLGAGPGFSVDCTVGAVIVNDDNSDFDKLYRCADTALYAAKQAGKGRFGIFNPDGSIELQKRS